jgi:lysophospholipase L1-like esterase
MERAITFAVLGDSAASGIGDADVNGVNRGWAYYLTQSFHHPIVYWNLARPGAKSLEVLEFQLPNALLCKPEIAAVIVGGNDALRNGFSPSKLHENLQQTISQLRAIGTHVILLQLHDPTKIVPLPRLLARVLRRRINAVNRVTQSLANEFGADVLQTRRINNIYDRKVWHVDRMHPSKFGHQLLAKYFREILLQKDWSIAPIQIDGVKEISKVQSVKWMLRNGTPWFLKRSVDLFPAAMLLMLAELLRPIVRRGESDLSNLYFADFQPQSIAHLQEVYEERVS